MKLSLQKKSLSTAIPKIQKAKDFGSTCTLTSDESYVIYKLLTDTAIRIADIQAKTKG